MTPFRGDSHFVHCMDNIKKIIDPLDYHVYIHIFQPNCRSTKKWLREYEFSNKMKSIEDSEEEPWQGRIGVYLRSIGSIVRSMISPKVYCLSNDKEIWQLYWPIC
ncbi:hypothetical protein PVK06_034936 [Gossypium arboreum]|uniref:Uncharacterized protein n=1 Tax=Gossypium arboreum TaxID=29729 RepID=A0ABR0NFJ5_GOSAR|nr:hypothetical protein PVK06_034936 [Gossypium arboreum]